MLDQQFESVSREGEPTVAVVVRSARYGWTVAVGLPKTALYKPAIRVTLQAFAAAGILAVIGLALALYFARQIDGPVLALSGAAAELGRDRVPAPLRTGLSEADQVGAALHEAGMRSARATEQLESRVAEAIRQTARTPGGGLTVGDPGAGPGGIGEGLNLPPAPGVQGSALELKSDPMGVDFRPYLTQILATIRRNWNAVMPESVKLGRRGKVGLTFSISRVGRVDKMVYAFQSGSDPLDRAAIAAISASNPFPPLPGQFKGDRIVLQLNFAYNMPKQ